MPSQHKILDNPVVNLTALYLLTLCLLIANPLRLRAQGTQPPNPSKSVLDRLHAMTAWPLADWRAHAANLPHPEDPTLNDSNWEALRVRSRSMTGPVWFRRWVEIPQRVGGYEISGARVRLDLDISSDQPFTLRVFFNGSQVATQTPDTLQPILITASAQPPQKFLMALGVMGQAVPVWLNRAQLLVDFSPGSPDPGRLRDEILVCQAILPAVAEGKHERESQLDAAVKAIDFGPLDRGDQQAFQRSMQLANEKLQPLRDWMKQFTVRAVGNAHIDMAWLWPWTETVEVVRDTFSTALQLMREYPGFIYAHSSAQTYVWMEEKYPQLFQEIQQRVKEGRWEIVGGMWVEPDLNLPTGESLVRQLLVGKRYFQEKFGVDVKIGWNPDSFGYNWQLPQIYKRSGLDYFVTQKMSWNDTTKFPYKLFWWQSPDGSKVLTYFPHDYVNEIEPVRIATDVGEYVSQTGFPELLHLYGIGDHGGGPTRAMLDSALSWQKSDAVFPTLIFSTAQGFFDDLNKSAGKLKIPVWNDELYFEYHRGVQTTQAETKRRIRDSEHLLLNAEKFASLAYLYGQPYPHQEFESAWRGVLFDQFHDIMPGSGIAVNYLDAARNLEVVALAGNKVLRNAQQEIAARVDTRGVGVPVIVFNPLSWTRTDPVEVRVQFPEPVSAVEVHDASGRVLVSDVVARDDTTHTIVPRTVAENIPAFGYEVVRVVPATSGPSARSTLKADAGGMENEFLRVMVDGRTGCITSLFDKKAGRETLASGACGNLLQAFHDKPKEYDAWNIDADFEKQKWDLMDAEEVRLVENTPVRAVLRVKKKFQNSSFVQDICMYPGVPRVDVNMQADWHEKHILLKVAFPIAAQSDFATFEIPYGTIRRPTTRNTPAEKAKFEVPAQQWGDLSDSAHGLSLLNMSKYGYDAKGNVLRLSLLRSPTSPDPHADEGFHEFTYALYPHAGDWKQGDTEHEGYQLNYPLIAFPSVPHEGSLPPSHSFLELDSPNVILTAVKKAEADSALILRFYEFAGKESELHLRLPGTASRAAETNLMEKEESPLTVGAGAREVVVPTHPYEIKTVKVWFEGRT
jgi:alpha-mannosidase